MNSIFRAIAKKTTVRVDSGLKKVILVSNTLAEITPIQCMVEYFDRIVVYE